jgi:AraC-like DNA-binding protein
LDLLYKGNNLKTLLIEPIMDRVYNSHGNISIEELATTAKMSQRSMERHFHSTIGVSPKEFIRIIRSHHAVTILQKGKSVGRMNEIAYELGYYDAAHFIKEIKKHSGFKPSEIFRGHILLSG